MLSLYFINRVHLSVCKLSYPLSLLTVKSENGDANREQHELLVKDRDSESRTQLRSDSDNRSHVSGMSSHPSHSSQSQSTTSQSHSQRSRRGSYDRLVFPRHDLVTTGMLGKTCCAKKTLIVNFFDCPIDNNQI